MELLPDLSWDQFKQCCTGDPRFQFEEMTRRLFIEEFIDSDDIPYSETSHPGVEIEPVFKSKHLYGSVRKRISFQSKFFDNKVDYDQIKRSAEVAVKHYQGKLDCIYLFCNLTINPSKSSKYQARPRSD